MQAYRGAIASGVAGTVAPPPVAAPAPAASPQAFSAPAVPAQLPAVAPASAPAQVATPIRQRLGRANTHSASNCVELNGLAARACKASASLLSSLRVPDSLGCVMRSGGHHRAAGRCAFAWGASNQPGCGRRAHGCSCRINTAAGALGR